MKYPFDTRMEVLGLFYGRTLGTFLSNFWLDILGDVSESLLMTSENTVESRIQCSLSLVHVCQPLHNLFVVVLFFRLIGGQCCLWELH